MLANRVKETSTTVGTGNLTLAGAATGFQSFNTAFGTDRRFSYWIVDDTANVWETGIGYLSASTTFVRETVLDNSSGTTSALSLAGNTVDVFIATSEHMNHRVAPSLIADTGSGHVRYIQGSNLNLHTAASADSAPNVLYFTPHLLEYAGNVDAFVIEVTTAGATGARTRVGIYSTGSDGAPDKLILESGEINCESTGVKEDTFTARKFKPGWYWLGMVMNDTTIGYRALHLPHQYNTTDLIGCNDALGGVLSVSQSHTYGALPASTSITTNSNWIEGAKIMLRAV